METTGKAVLDASALLAYLHGEPGADAVEETLRQGAFMSSANWAEVLSKLVDEGVGEVDAILGGFRAKGLFGHLFGVLPLTGEDGAVVARLRGETRSHGLSLGDRAALALAMRLGLPVLTTDRAWQNLSVGIAVRLIR
jgi:PIN domain nuclease of toxin-antitoxin system